MFGSSCLTVDITLVAPPRLGQSLQLTVASGWYGSNGKSGQSLLHTGVSNSHYAGLTLPFDTSILTKPGVFKSCGFLYTSIDVVLAMPGGRPYSGPTPLPLSIPIPNDPSLLGVSFYQQALIFMRDNLPEPILALGRGAHGVIGN